MRASTTPLRLQATHLLSALALFALLAVAGAPALAEGAARRVQLALGSPELAEALARGGLVLEEYESFLLVELPDEAPRRHARVDKGHVYPAPLGYRVGLADHPIDTSLGLPRALTLHNDERALGAAAKSDGGGVESDELLVVQFHGPIKDAWLETLRRAGVEPLVYVPENAYLVRAPAELGGDLRALDFPRGPASRSPLQWSGRYEQAYRVAGELADAKGRVLVAASLLKGKASEELAERAASEGELVLAPFSRGELTHLVLELDASELERLVARADLLRVEPWSPPIPMGEVGALNVAGGRVNGDVAGYGQIGMPYLDWLASKGFDVGGVSDLLVNVSDTGLDLGESGGSGHPDLLGPGALARVAYVRDWTTDAGTQYEGIDGDGHGTNCAGVIAGYNADTTAGSGTVSTTGYRFGLGVAPFVRLGGSKIFTFAGVFSLQGSYADVEQNAWNEGARISSNSWGSNHNGYTWDAQAFDAIVRDASSEAGNQEMIVLFAAGNGGYSASGSEYRVGSPATAKNVITLAAAENWWPSNQACGWPTWMQDSPGDDIACYSSPGPSADGRRKPDLAAIANGWVTLRGSQAGEGCGAPYDTASAALYRNFNGTSAATPAAAGAAALVYELSRDRWGGAPSPALVKAALAATSRDMRGGHDCVYPTMTLTAMSGVPNERQGHGLVDTGRVLDEVPKRLVDQSHVFSASGQLSESSYTIADPQAPLRVALAWTDAPGSTLGDAWVNDLDLEVEVGGVTYLGNVLTEGVSVAGGSADARNNLEVVRLPAGLSGDFSVRVRATNIAGDGLPGNGDATDQDFALFVYNAACTLPAPSLLGALSSGANEVTLSFGAASGSPDAYRVYRRDAAGALSLVAEIPASSTSYVDQSVPSAGSYTYFARAYDATARCESPDSPSYVVQVEGDCSLAPSFNGLREALPSGESTCGASLSWEAASSRCGGEVVYDVYRGHGRTPDPEAEAPIAAGVSGTSFVDAAGLLSGESYTYVVRARELQSGVDDANLIARTVQAGNWATYPSAPGSAIADLFTLSETMQLPSGVAMDVLVGLEIEHTYIGDLFIDVVGPLGQSVGLRAGSGGSTDNLLTTFDTLSQPDDGDLSVFDGLEAGGTWTLQVYDNAQYDTGTLVAWDIQTLGACMEGEGPGEVSPGGDLLVAQGAGSALTLSVTPASLSTDASVYLGRTMGALGALSWTAAYCELGPSGTLSFEPGKPASGELFYFVAAANDGAREGTLGDASTGAERAGPGALACALDGGGALASLQRVSPDRPRPTAASLREGKAASDETPSGEPATCPLRRRWSQRYVAPEEVVKTPAHCP